MPPRLRRFSPLLRERTCAHLPPLPAAISDDALICGCMLSPLSLKSRSSGHVTATLLIVRGAVPVETLTWRKCSSSSRTFSSVLRC